MHPQAYASRSSSEAQDSPARQRKSSLQRQYREKEQEHFTLLRDAVKELTGEDPPTRQEILKKARELVQYLGSEFKRMNPQTTGYIIVPHRPGSQSPSSYHIGVPRRSEPQSPPTVQGPYPHVMMSPENQMPHPDYTMPVPPPQWPWLGNSEFHPPAIHSEGGGTYGQVTNEFDSPMPEIDLWQGFQGQSSSHYRQHPGSRSHHN
ncbi:hypothetical protein BU15DRAFT_64730 [Melanogaster broomeanus]|nr:hypothetical protein BU15DRAFT_64730 [Melanogaster broomeanus]